MVATFLMLVANRCYWHHGGAVNNKNIQNMTALLSKNSRTTSLIYDNHFRGPEGPYGALKR